MKIETPEAIANWVKSLKEKNVKYVRFELPDLHGVSRVKIVPISKVEGYACKGLNFYSGTIALDTASNIIPGSGYHEEYQYRDQLLFPDITSCRPVPWIDNTVKVICDGYWGPGEPLTVTSRYLLHSLLDRAQQLGFEVMMGHEFEFYLLDGKTRKPLYEGHQVFNHMYNNYVVAISQLLDYLQEAGIDVITHNCEYGPSQFEINYGPSIGIEAADKAFTFKNAVKEISHHLGYHATFMTKPLANMPGSGCHFHLSLWRDGVNAFVDPNSSGGLSSTAKFFIQGILDHAPGMLALANPTPNCYHRLKPHSLAPCNISWGMEDRTALVRVKGTGDEDTHLEMRGASALSNPYLTAAATLAAGLLGLEEQRELQPIVEGPSEEDPSLPPLPKTLEAALDALATDASLQNMLGRDFCQMFSTVKYFELGRFHDHITDWEDFVGINKCVEELTLDEWQELDQNFGGQVVINASYSLHHIVSDAIRNSNQEMPQTDKRDRVLHYLYQLNPVGFVLLEGDVNFNTKDFFQRFESCWQLYETVFRMVDDLEHLTDTEKLTLKLNFFGREIEDIISKDKPENRHESMEPLPIWAERLVQAGFYLKQDFSSSFLPINHPLITVRRNRGYTSIEYDHQSVVGVLVAQVKDPDSFV